MRHFPMILAAVCAAAPVARGEIVPAEQRRRLEAKAKPIEGTSEQRFEELVSAILPVVEETVRAHGGRLEKKTEWASTTVNATAYERGDVWTIHVWGGLYRVDGMTDDAFQLAICHEAGHLLGGFPYYGGAIAATSEGQADYYAAHVCTPKLWRDELAVNRAVFAAAPAQVQDRCLAAHADSAAANVCARIAVAGEKLMNVLAGGTFSLATPSTDVATATLFSSYPSSQCRVDTYYRGALCTVDWDFSVIPGRNDEPRNGTGAEASAHRYSCHRGNLPDAARPRCWYTQRVD